ADVREYAVAAHVRGVDLDLVLPTGIQELRRDGRSRVLGRQRHVQDALLIVPGHDDLVVDSTGHGVPTDDRVVGGQRPAVLWLDEHRRIEDVVRERHLGFQVTAVDGRALEAVVALGEQLLELVERQLGERWLAALREQLAEAEVAQDPLRLDVQDPATVGTEDLELPPLLRVREHLDAGIPIGGVELDLESRIVERFGRFFRRRLRNARDDQWGGAKQRRTSQSGKPHRPSPLPGRTARRQRAPEGRNRWTLTPS